MENHGRAKKERERKREKDHFSPYRNDEKRICIRVSVFKLSQWRVYMEIPRAMSPTKVPGIELNITVAQRWSSNRLPMVKWKYSWRNVCIFPSSFPIPTRATRFIKIAFCAFRPPLHSARVVIHRVYIFLFHVHFRNVRNLENFKYQETRMLFGENLIPQRVGINSSFYGREWVSNHEKNIPFSSKGNSLG